MTPTDWTDDGNVGPSSLVSLNVPGLAGITQRIGAIEQRLGADARAPATVGTLDPIPFEPFGEIYQSALEARDAAPGPAPMPTPLPVPMPATSMPHQWRQTAADLSGVPSPPYGGGSRAISPIESAAIAGLAGVPGARPVGGYGKMPVPPELAPYGNGRVPPEALAPIAQSGHRLLGPAAASWDNVVAAAAQDGIDLRITDSYRSYENQVSLAERKGLYSQGGLAATPGTSNHGWGLAVDADVTDPRTMAWLRENGPRFGWVEAVPREPWHWEFRPHQV